MLLNCYGPTEATIWATSRVISPTDDEVAIGAPLPGYACHLFDEARRPIAAAGQVGELYIGGVGVARGYLKRPELTAAAFVPDPRGSGSRLYRTGDLARWREDGTLVCLGRIDSQVTLQHEQAVCVRQLVGALPQVPARGRDLGHHTRHGSRPDMRPAAPCLVTGEAARLPPRAR